MDDVSGKMLVIFQNVNEWLKFAETKNGILLAFSGAGITATVTVLATAQKIPHFLLIGLLITTSLLCACAFVCSLSFLPKTNLERLLSLQNKPRNSNILVKDTDNLYFYGDLQKYDPAKLLNALNQHYFEDKINVPYKKEYQDIAVQIIINSKIAFLKFKVFTYAIYILIASILVIPCAIMISLFIERSL